MSTASVCRPHERILLVSAEGSRELGEMFLRPQEFYESPSRKFRGRFFTHDQFKRYYKRAWGGGHFSYFSDYQGYNMPGAVFNEWAATYAGRETEAEQKLLTLLGPVPSDFYLIGARDKDVNTLEHEFSHAFFHLCAWYRELCLMQLGLWKLDPVKAALRKIMYREEVLEDECIAYLLFDERWLCRAGVAISHYATLRRNLKSLYDQVRAEYLG